MKKTLTINLGGTVYYIDEDAYHLLDNYLTNLRIHFCREGKRLRDSILSPIFHSYIFAIYKNESLWI